MAVKKGNTNTEKAKTWDPNSEQQWHTDKAAGGAAWAQRFIDGTRGQSCQFSPTWTDQLPVQ
jgi:hypothetical protein